MRSIVSHYLPGMSDARAAIHRQHCGCSGEGHCCSTSQIGSKQVGHTEPGTTVVTLSKSVAEGSHRHAKYARLTLDPAGKVTGLAIFAVVLAAAAMRPMPDPSGAVFAFFFCGPHMREGFYMTAEFGFLFDKIDLFRVSLTSWNDGCLIHAIPGLLCGDHIADPKELRRELCVGPRYAVGPCDLQVDHQDRPGQGVNDTLAACRSVFCGDVRYADLPGRVSRQDQGRPGKEQAKQQGWNSSRNVHGRLF